MNKKKIVDGEIIHFGKDRRISPDVYVSNSSLLNNSQDNGLLYALYYGVFLHHDMLEEDVCVIDREVSALCVHNNKVYYAESHFGIYDLLENVLVAKRPHKIWSMCSYNNIVYDGGDEGVIRETFSNKIIGRRKESDNSKAAIYSLYTHQGILYDTGTHRRMHDTIKNKVVKRFPEDTIYSAKSFNGTLYGILTFTVNNLDTNTIINNDQRALSLEQHNNKLYVCGGNGVYDIHTEERIINQQAYSICSISADIVKKVIIKKGFTEKIK